MKTGNGQKDSANKQLFKSMPKKETSNIVKKTATKFSAKGTKGQKGQKGY